MKLKFIGSDYWDRPVYVSPKGKLICDIDPRPGYEPALYSKSNNEFDGEPEYPISCSVDVDFVPHRITW